MPIKVDINSSLQALIDAKSRRGLLPMVRTEFSKNGPKKIKQAIVQDMIKGISPVKSKGKWKRYSPSYKEQIKGTAAYRKVGGKVIKFTDPKVVEKLNAGFRAKQSPSKRISPVNLRLSGDLHKSLFARTIGGFIKEPYVLLVGFKHKLADIHNRLGAGKSKVKRRLLPTKSGESFNRRITSVLVDELKKAADKVAKQFSGQ